MEALEGINTGSVGVWRNGGGLVKWGLDWMGLPDTGLVEMLEVNSPPGITILLGHNHHPGTPSGWFTNRNFLKHTHLHIVVKTSLNFVLPVDRNRVGFVEGHWLGIWVNM